jgi:pimeloyl-ACP methyl ester carboxylesterase
MFDHDYVEVNGIRLHVVSKGSGKTVLFLHGFPEFWYLWRHQLEEFGADHRAVAVDQRGYNLSDKPEGVDAYAMKHLVADVKGLFDHLSGGEPSILVGHDFGASISWSFAMKHPEYLEKLVILNGPHPIMLMRQFATSGEQREASDYMHMLRGPDSEEKLSVNGFQPMFDVMVGGSTKPETFSDEDREAYRESWRRPGALTAALNYYRALPSGPPRNDDEVKAAAAFLEDLLARRSFVMEVPTLVIWGVHDIALKTGLIDGLDEFVPNLRIQRVEDGSHWLINEQPDTVNAAMRSFLEER